MILISCALLELLAWEVDWVQGVSGLAGTYQTDAGETWELSRLGGLTIAQADGTRYRWGWGISYTPRHGRLLVIYAPHGGQLACYGLGLAVALVPGGHRAIAVGGIWLREIAWAAE